MWECVKGNISCFKPKHIQHSVFFRVIIYQDGIFWPKAIFFICWVHWHANLRHIYLSQLSNVNRSCSPLQKIRSAFQYKQSSKDHTYGSYSVKVLHSSSSNPFKFCPGVFHLHPWKSIGPKITWIISKEAVVYFFEVQATQCSGLNGYHRIQWVSSQWLLKCF